MSRRIVIVSSSLLVALLPPLIRTALAILHVKKNQRYLLIDTVSLRQYIKFWLLRGTIRPPRNLTLVVVQRHGETWKNLCLKDPKRRSLEAVQHASTQTERDSIIKKWQTIANNPEFFDDKLTANGWQQSRQAGMEIHQLFRRFGITDDNYSVLRISSPFRRALETNMCLKPKSAILHVHDALSETPFDESACKRRPRSQIARVYCNEQLDLQHVDETYDSILGLDQITAALNGDIELRSIVQPRLREFIRAFLKPHLSSSLVIWITTHKGIATPLISELAGIDHIELNNAQAYVFSLPHDI
mmetsp:Transcript_9091/g.14000  ORF Transcript_9091/g.14000 Transcript_9091/m.14000 type:complete len:302 (+) Transcript_9091:71-976(+)